MEVDEAQLALDQIRMATEQTWRAVARSGTGWIFIIWGCGRFIGYLGSQLLGGVGSGVLWLVLDILGGPPRPSSACARGAACALRTAGAWADCGWP